VAYLQKSKHGLILSLDKGLKRRVWEKVRCGVKRRTIAQCKDQLKDQRIDQRRGKGNLSSK